MRPISRRAALQGAACALAVLLAPGGASQGGEPPPTPTRRGAAPRSITLSRSETLNVVDNALFRLAEKYLSSGRDDAIKNAIGVLEHVATKSPDAPLRKLP